MIRTALNRLRRWFSRNRPEMEFARVAVSEERLREMLCAGEKDLLLRTTASGVVTAECKTCRQALDIAQDRGLLWFRCPTCRRVSFNAIGNVHRDIHYAAKDGQPFEYELFYVDNLPPPLQPPFRDG